MGYGAYFDYTKNEIKENIMRLIIDIPEEYYEKVIKTIPDWQASADTLMIKNGTPLPKGHGRLIDADALIDSLDASDRDIYCKAVIEEDAPTIIEADGGDAE